ncbi:MAG: isoprenylcysteine carboxylmethyltransferase family protein [Methanomicrobiaceae archaeon]|nr:isoprenylcysteine carboxylmethyltransferase family protein [Methanomicrobiaceae archaeon]
MSLKEAEEMRGRKKGRRSSAGIVEIVVLIAVPVLCHYLIPVMIVIAPPYSYTGAVVMLAGLGFMMWAARVFGLAGTGFRLREGGSVLVTSGPFRYSRNPMYLGMLIWLIGFAVLLGSLVVFVFPVLFFLLAESLLIPQEERRMEQMFGERFTGYRRRVRRWL